MFLVERHLFRMTTISWIGTTKNGTGEECGGLRRQTKMTIYGTVFECRNGLSCHKIGRMIR